MDKVPTRTLFLNASITHTMSSEGSAAAWCVDNTNGTFVEVGSIGSARAACGHAASVVDLRGATVVPGLIDSHLHLLYGGYKLARPQLDRCSSAADVVETLQACSSSNSSSSSSNSSCRQYGIKTNYYY